jgi:LuxR family transcriptional regulator
MVAIDQVSEILTDLKTISPTGFAIALHIDFTTPRFLIQTYDDAWMQYYSSNGLHMKDPAVLWGFQNNGMASDDDLMALDSHGVFEDAKRFGLNNWAVLSTAEHGSKSISAFSRPDRGFNEAERARLSEDFQKLHSITLSAADADPSFAELMNRLSVSLTHRG